MRTDTCTPQHRPEWIRVDRLLGEHHSGERNRETAEARAERIIAEELGRRGWTESDLASRRKSDPGKLAIGSRLRKETTLLIKAIATRLHRGTSKSANARLHQWMAKTEKSQSPKDQF